MLLVIGIVIVFILGAIAILQYRQIKIMENDSDGQYAIFLAITGQLDEENEEDCDCEECNKKGE